VWRHMQRQLAAVADAAVVPKLASVGHNVGPVVKSHVVKQMEVRPVPVKNIVGKVTESAVAVHVVASTVVALATYVPIMHVLCAGVKGFIYLILK